MDHINKNSVILKQEKNIKSIDIDKLKRDAIEAKKDEVLDAQRSQMRAGRMGNGFMPDYSPLSKKLKDKTNYKAKWPKMDLYDTGSFQDKMTIDLTNKSVFIDSTDSKTDDLVGRFSDQIFEPDKKTMKINADNVTHEFNKLFHKEINK